MGFQISEQYLRQKLVTVSPVKKNVLFCLELLVFTECLFCIEYIQVIMGLEEEVQHDVMNAIQEVIISIYLVLFNIDLNKFL